VSEALTLGHGPRGRSYDRRVTSAAEVKAVLRRYPFGVSVVTVDLEGERLGLTVGSLASIALEPPLVAVSIARGAALHELLRAAGGFAVSLLAADQVELAQHFARGVPPIALWHQIAIREGTRAPLLEGAVGWLECGLQNEHRAGDHTIFLARVEHAEQGLPKPPLVRFGGEYRSG
jgi:flavin reductase